jgi:TPR repeat protein
MTGRWQLLARRFGLVAFVFFFGLGMVASDLRAQTYEAGLRAFNQAQYDRAEAEWLPLARSGDLRSQYALAVLYEKRGGRDPAFLEQAAEWYRRAAEQGHPGAQTNYASLLAQGAGVAKDQPLAVHYWQLAARQDNLLAQYNLGLAYYRGEGVVPDATRALGWFRRAADAGMADAQFAMGQMNALGVGTARNPGRALTWFALAEAQGHNDAGRQAQRLREEGVVAAAPGTPLPVAEDAEVPPVAETAERPPAIEEEADAAEAPTGTAPAAAASEADPEPATEVATAPAAKPETLSEPEKTESGVGLLWLGSFAERAEAETFKDKTIALYGARFAERPLQVEPAGEGRFRVMVAGLPDSEAALAFCRTLKRDIENAFCAVLQP